MLLVLSLPFFTAFSRSEVSVSMAEGREQVSSPFLCL